MPVHTPSHYHKSRRGPFENPWPPVLTMMASAMALMKLPFERATPYEHDLEYVKTVKTVKPNFGALDDTEKLCAMWLGHAGYLVQLPAEASHRPIRILFDPMFSERAFPSAWVGPKRRLEAPCRVDELPEIDFVAKTANKKFGCSYDHCDLDALRALSNKSHATLFLVPLGMEDNLRSVGIPSPRIFELDWWDTLLCPLDGRMCNYRFTCTPAQHNSGRGMLDQNWTLWCGWSIQQEHKNKTWASTYFAGDTGYQTLNGPCPAFKEIGEKLGPFTLAIVPIWSGASLTFLGKMGYRLSDDSHLVTLHATPEDAVKLVADVRAKNALAMHFGTFAGSDDEALEPAVRLAKASSPDQVHVQVIDVGECMAFEPNLELEESK